MPNTKNPHVHCENIMDYGPGNGLAARKWRTKIKEKASDTHRQINTKLFVIADNEILAIKIDYYSNRQ